MSWLMEIFGTEKPIIGMCHLQALPGDPHYDESKGMKWIVEKAYEDLNALQEGGIDAVMFSNEFSFPYLTRVKGETIASMGRIIGELKSKIKIPYGVNVLWDPIASLDLAISTDALFVREIFSGVYASDFGLWNTSCGESVRHQHAIGAAHIKLLFNIVPEAAMYLAPRNLTSIAKSTVFNCKPDALCVSGLTAGVQPDSSALTAVKEAVPNTVVFVNTGCNIDNIEQNLSVADGAIVGTTFKKEGIFENAVDEQRVKNFMQRVKSFRASIKNEYHSN